MEHSHEKEAQSKDTLGTLRSEIENLRHSIDQGAGTSIVQENRVRELGAERDELHRERDSHAQQVSPNPTPTPNPSPSPSPSPSPNPNH